MNLSITDVGVALVLFLILIVELYATFVCGFLSERGLDDFAKVGGWRLLLCQIGMITSIFITLFGVQGMATGSVSPYPWDEFFIALHRGGLLTAVFFPLFVLVCQCWAYFIPGRLYVIF